MRIKEKTTKDKMLDKMFSHLDKSSLKVPRMKIVYGEQ